MNKKTQNNSIFFLKASFSFAVLYYCFTLIDTKELATHLSKVDTLLFLASLTVNILGTILCKSVLVAKLIGQNKEISLLQVISVNLALRFYTILLPRGSVAIIRWHKYKNLSNGFTSLTILGIESIFTLFLLSLGSVVFYLLSPPYELPSIIFLISLAITILLFIVLSSFYYTKIIYVAYHLSYRLIRIKLIKGFLRKLRRNSKTIKINSKKNVALAITTSFTSYIFFVLSSYLLAVSMSLSIDILTIAWIRSMVLILAHIPIFIAGLGIRELGFISLFGFCSISPDIAIAYAVASFSLQLIIAAIGAAIEGYIWLTKED